MALNLLAYWDFDTLNSGQFADRTGRGATLSADNGSQAAAKVGTYGLQQDYGADAAEADFATPLSVMLFGWFTIYELVNGWTSIVSIDNPELSIEILDDGSKITGVRGKFGVHSGATHSLDMEAGEWLFFAVNLSSVNLAARPLYTYAGGDSSWTANGLYTGGAHGAGVTNLEVGDNSNSVGIDELAIAGAALYPFGVGTIEWVWNSGVGRHFSDFGYIPDPEADPDPEEVEEDLSDWSGYFEVTSQSSQIEHAILQAYIDLSLIPSDNDWWNNVALDGHDIRITDSLGNPLKFRIETFDRTAKTGLLQFDSSSTLSDSSNVTYRIYAGNDAADPPPDYLVHSASGSPLFAFDLAQDPSGPAPQLKDLLKHVPATAHGMTSDYLVPGQVGGATGFITNKYATFAGSSFNQPVSAATLMCWVRFYSWTETSGNIITARNYGNGVSSGIAIDRATNRLRGLVAESGTWTRLLTSDDTVEADIWYHVAVTYESGATRLYLNGVQQAATSGGSGAISWESGHNWTFGETLDSGGFRFNGELDEVQLYGRALSLSEILTHYRNQFSAGGIWTAGSWNNPPTSPGGGSASARGPFKRVFSSGFKQAF